MRRCIFGFTFLLFLLFLVACTDEQSPADVPVTVTETAVLPAPATTTVADPVSIPPTETAVPPSPTPSEPLAALVNGDPIFLATYEKELARYEQAQAELAGLGLTPATADADYRKQVLDTLIEQKLIAQAADGRNIVVTPEMVDEKLAELRTAANDSGDFDAWLQANQYTLDEFRTALATGMLVELVVAEITLDVPYAVEQVRARYLQVDDLALAQSLHEQILNGNEFAPLARQHSLDRVTAEKGGDLEFFARGSLLVPEVEAAAFALEPGELSDVITASTADGTQTTYYLVQVIERDPQRPLTANMRYTLLQQTFEAWLQEQWERATIERFVNTGV